MILGLASPALVPRRDQPKRHTGFSLVELINLLFSGFKWTVLSGIENWITRMFHGNVKNKRCILMPLIPWWKWAQIWVNSESACQSKKYDENRKYYKIRVCKKRRVDIKRMVSWVRIEQGKVEGGREERCTWRKRKSNERRSWCCLLTFGWCSGKVVGNVLVDNEMQSAAAVLASPSIFIWFLFSTFYEER